MLLQALNPLQLHQDVDYLYFPTMNIVMTKTTIPNAIGMVVLVVAIPFLDGILIVQTVNALIPMLAPLLLLQNAKMNGLKRNVIRRKTKENVTSSGLQTFARRHVRNVE